MKAKFRNPDSIQNVKEELIKLTKKQYQQVSGSRAIGPFMRLDGSNKSKSFNVLINGLHEIKMRE